MISALHCEEGGSARLIFSCCGDGILRQPCLDQKCAAADTLANWCSLQKLSYSVHRGNLAQSAIGERVNLARSVHVWLLGAGSPWSASCNSVRSSVQHTWKARLKAKTYAAFAQGTIDSCLQRYMFILACLIELCLARLSHRSLMSSICNSYACGLRLFVACLF